MRVGVDTGGTFTDFVVLEEQSGHLFVFKRPSSSGDQARAIVGGLVEFLSDRQLDGSEVRYFAHGTTVATNAILEGTGAVTGLLVTEGFRGIYEVGEQARGVGSVIYDLFYEKPPALVPPRLTEEVAERIDAQGHVLKELDLEQARQAIDKLVHHGIESLAVALLFSFRNPEHELALKAEIARVAPHINVSISSDVAPQIREYYRLSTTVVNAYLNPLLEHYVASLAKQLDDLGVHPRQRYIIRSNGGTASFEVARQRSVQTILSGPAAGVVAAQKMAEASAINDLVTFDMGGTSTDVALIKDGQAIRRMGGKVHRLDVQIPMLDIHTVAAGGGTIAWVDDMGALQVGPRSAGSDPGPAAYARGGTEPTITDANLVLGWLDAARPLAGGTMGLDRGRAEAAIRQRVAEPLGISVTEAASGMIEIVNVKMQEAIKVVSSNRGYDLRDFYLFAFGGAGPLHACQIAEDLGMRGVVVPPYPGVTSALGLLLSDVRHDYVISELASLADADVERVNRIFSDLQARGQEQLNAEGFAPSACRYLWDLDLRYRGQGYELTVGIAPRRLDTAALESVRRQFDQEHARYTGHSAPDEAVEIVNYRVSAVAAVPPVPMTAPLSQEGTLATARVAMTRIFLHGQWQEVPVYERTRLAGGLTLVGPAVVTQADSTTVIHRGHVGRTDPERGQLWITREDTV